MNAAEWYIWIDVTFLHVVRSSAVVSLVDTMEISGGSDLFPWQPIHPASVFNECYLQTGRRSSYSLHITSAWFLSGPVLLKWCALTLLIPNHESFKACGRGGNVTSPGSEHVRRLNRALVMCQEGKKRAASLWMFLKIFIITDIL